MTQEEQKAVEEFTEINLTKKGLYHYNDMQDAFLIGLFKGEKMQSSLPSDLDEAAEKYSENILANNEDLQDAIEDAFKAGAEWMAGQGFPNWRDIEKTKPRQGEPCACVTVTYNGRIKYNNFENGPWYWSDKADFLSEKGAFVGTNDWGDKETHLCSYWMPWDELFAVLEKQLKEKQ